MDINLKLKERRKKIEKIKTREKTKAIRNYKKDIKEVNTKDNKNNNEYNINQLIEKEKKREEYEKKYGFNLNEEEEKNKSDKNKSKKNNYLTNKRTREEIEKEKEKKLSKRKKIYRNLHKTNKFGQPLMKYQLQNIFQKIKNKKEKRII